MNKQPQYALLAAAIAALTPLATAQAQDFATTVASSSNLDTRPLYGDPTAALGQPSTLLSDGYHASLVYPAYGNNSDGSKSLVLLDTSGTITLEFDSPIVHSDRHWYGDDFIVFANSRFNAPGITATTDMSKEIISGGLYQNGVPTVQVSSDGSTWVTLQPKTAYFPTEAYTWDTTTGDWSSTPQNSFTKPIAPGVTVDDFTNVSAADADNVLYNGSAGGAAFSLAGSGLDSIQFIQISGGGGNTPLDAVSRVGFDPSAAPEPSALAVFALGGFGLIAAAYRRKRTI